MTLCGFAGCLAAVLPAAFIGVALSGAQPVQQAERVVCLGTVSGGAAQRVAVSLGVDDGSSIAGFQIDVSYPPELLSPAGVRLGRDTSGGGWFLDGYVLSPGLVRILGYSSPPKEVGGGFRIVAQLDLDILSVETLDDMPLPLSGCVLADVESLRVPCVVCVQPGLDAAFPRFAQVIADDSFFFTPGTVVLEEGDWVLWEHAGTLEPHTTTEGAGCVGGGAWDATLYPGSRFLRRFESKPRRFDYFCRPHCGAGEPGVVDVIAPIRLAAGGAPEGPLWVWEGGSGRSRVWRSSAPAFVGVGVRIFTPDGGDGGTSFTDQDRPSAGSAFFYLVTPLP